MTKRRCQWYDFDADATNGNNCGKPLEKLVTEAWAHWQGRVFQHPMHLPLNALRAFEASARHLNLTHAAQELHVTQTAVSQHIRNLETHVRKPSSRHARMREHGRARKPGRAHATKPCVPASGWVAGFGRSGAGTTDAAWWRRR